MMRSFLIALMMACGQAMPQVAELAQHVVEAFEELKALPPTAAVAGTPVAGKTTKKANKGRPVPRATRAAGAVPTNMTGS